MAQHKSDRYVNLVRAVIRHALAHRRMAGWFADFVGRVMIATDFAGHKYESFTHCYAAFDRNGKQHRNTSRVMAKELAEMQLITWLGYRSRGQRGGRNEFYINRSRVYRYASDHGITPIMPDRDAAPTLRPRTKADWDREMDAWREARRKAADDAREAARAEHARQEAEAPTTRASNAQRDALADEWKAKDPRMAHFLTRVSRTRHLAK